MRTIPFGAGVRIGILRHLLAASCVISLGFVGMVREAAAETPEASAAQVASKRADQPPRKVLLGTFLAGYRIFDKPLEQRLDKMDEVADSIADRASGDYPGKPLDLVVFPEYFLARPGDSLAQKTVRLGEVLPRIAACATKHRCYLVVPILLHEDSLTVRYSNAAVLADRQGKIVGIYRKVHPVADEGSEVLEGGLTPGHDFPVFDCDFGRVGIQICFDMLYADGWDALSKKGAEIVVLPSASPEATRPCMYALQHEYYIISAAPRDHAAVFSPLGLIEDQVTEQGALLVHQIDLSFAEVHWEKALEEGAALSRRYGQNVGYQYYRSEDKGLFWSNDPKMTIGQMISSLGLETSDANVERVRVLQDKARGGPPERP